MGMQYDQLVLDDRVEIYRLHEAGKSRREIARLMGRHPTTIWRELKRNSLPKGGYKAASAERMALSRCRRVSRIECLSRLGDCVRDRLAMGWSPEQIAGRLKLEGSEHTVSPETIYRFIYRPKVRPDGLYRYLPRAKTSRGRRYFKRRREPIPNRRPIAQRPETVASREEFGHWEGDLMQFRTQRGNLLTLCERMTRFTLTACLESKTALETREAVQASLGCLPVRARQTITFDNGSEFAGHRELENQLGLHAYFCDPHSPWQRGTVENTNGLLRRDMPRKTNITDYTPRDVEDLTWCLNSTPRKCLGFITPAEAFLKNLGVALEMGIQPPPGQARTLMRAHAVKRRSWLGLLHGELASWVGRIDGWFAL